MTKPTGRPRGRRAGVGTNKERDALLLTLGTRNVSLGQVRAGFHFDKAVTQRIIEATAWDALPRGCGPRGDRFKDLQHNLYQAVLCLLRDPGSTRIERLAHLREVEATAKRLQALIAKDWGDITNDVEPRRQRAITRSLGEKAAGAYNIDGLLDHQFFTTAIKAVALLARAGQRRVKQRNGLYDRMRRGNELMPIEPDRDEFFKRLAWAHWQFADSRDIDSLIRFVGAVSNELKLGIPTSAISRWVKPRREK